jgi:hypothetical protein
MATLQRIKESIAYYFAQRRRKTLRKRLIAGYQASAAGDLAIAHDWQALEEETWLTHVPVYEGEEPAHDATDTT